MAHTDKVDIILTCFFHTSFSATVWHVTLIGCRERCYRRAPASVVAGSVLPHCSPLAAWYNEVIPLATPPNDSKSATSLKYEKYEKYKKYKKYNKLYFGIPHPKTI